MLSNRRVSDSSKHRYEIEEAPNSNTELFAFMALFGEITSLPIWPEQ